MPKLFRKHLYCLWAVAEYPNADGYYEADKCSGRFAVAYDGGEAELEMKLGNFAASLLGVLHRKCFGITSGDIDVGADEIESIRIETDDGNYIDVPDIDAGADEIESIRIETDGGNYIDVPDIYERIRIAADFDEEELTCRIFFNHDCSKHRWIILKHVGWELRGSDTL